jgi:hypothetical protein
VCAFTHAEKSGGSRIPQLAFGNPTTVVVHFEYDGLADIAKGEANGTCVRVPRDVG